MILLSTALLHLVVQHIDIVSAEVASCLGTADESVQIGDPRKVAVVLGCAARAGDTHTIQKWLKEDGIGSEHLDAASDEGWRPLHEAAMGGHLSSLDLLLSHGASLNVQDNEGRFPLHWASLAGHQSASALLIAHGSHTQVPDSTLNLPFHGVATKGHADLAELFLQAGTPVDAQDGWQQTLLHAAVIDGHLPLIKLLLSYGAALDIPDVEGSTALQRAWTLAHGPNLAYGSVLSLLLEEASQRGMQL